MGKSSTSRVTLVDFTSVHGRSPTNCQVVNATQIEGFTQREVDRARAARRFYHGLSAKSVKNIEAFIQFNIAKNIPISTEDMNLVEKVFGPDIPFCKGKWAKWKPKVVKDNDTIKLPPELRVKGMQIELAVNILYIKAFLHIIDR